MEKWKAEFLCFVKNKYYVAALVLTAVFSYGFLITHQTVGIDDTPSVYYFEEGLATIVGRWVLFLFNKIFHMAEFAPFVTDLAGVMILMLGVTIWCVLLRRILRDRVPMYGYILFSCLFLSNPLISEVYTYYLHNGVSMGYLFCGISLCFLWEGLEDGIGTRKNANRKKQMLLWLGSAVGLLIAIGCYESFMVVYLVGVCAMLCMARLTEDTKVAVIRSVVIAGMIALVALIFRSVVVSGLTILFDLEYLKEEAARRSISEMLSWVLQPGAFSDFAMMVKRILVMYGIFAYAYYPIWVYVIAVVLAVVAGIIWSIRKKDLWIVLLVFAGIAASYLLVVVEGEATYYRSAQFLPMFCAWGLFMAVYTIHQLSNKRTAVQKWGNRILCAALCVILWNQCTDMNQWFYVDWMKYEDARNTIDKIAYELEKDFDTSKPVVFAGVHMVPEGIVDAAFVDYGSETYYKMQKIAALFDQHILEKFYREYGIWVAQTPALSVIDWSRRAFDNNLELIRFFSMHGYELQPYLNEAMYDTIEEEAGSMPHFPKAGSIVDKGEYIVVHF